MMIPVKGIITNIKCKNEKCDGTDTREFVNTGSKVKWYVCPKCAYMWEELMEEPTK